MKKKLLIFLVFFGLLSVSFRFTILASGLPVSKDVFPPNLNKAFNDPSMESYPRKGVFSHSESGIKEGYYASYIAKSGRKFIINLYEFKSSSGAKKYLKNWISERKKEAEDDYQNNKNTTLEKPQWSTTYEWNVAGIDVKTASAQRKSSLNYDVTTGTGDHFVYSTMAGVVDSVFITVQYSGILYYHPSRANEHVKQFNDDNQAVFEYIIPVIRSGGDFDVEVKKEDGDSGSFYKEPSKKSSDDDSFLRSAIESAQRILRGEKKEDKKEEKSPVPKNEERRNVCGDGVCDLWGEEDCQSCYRDCLTARSCCFPGYQYTYPRYYNSNYYYIYDSETGNIPEGMLLIEPVTTREEMFSESYQPKYCYNESIIEVDCKEDRDCARGDLCRNAHKCVSAKSVKPVKVDDIVMESVILKKAQSRKKSSLHTYIKYKDNMVLHKEGKGLEVELDVQGDTLGEKTWVGVGKELEVRLKIKNVSEYKIGIVPYISYPDNKIDKDDIVENSYTVSFGWWGGLKSLFGSLKSKDLGGDFLLMPPDSEVIVYSNITPNRMEPITIKGIYHYTSEDIFKDEELIYGFRTLDEAPGEYQTKSQQDEVEKTVFVNEPPCRIWPFCI